MDNQPKKIKPPFSTREKLLIVETDIAHLNNQLLEIDSRINELKTRKQSIRKRISKKTKYKFQLLNDEEVHLDSLLNTLQLKKTDGKNQSIT